MSFSTVLSAVIQGLKVEFVHVEVDVRNGLPAFHMVGYLSSEVREAADRVRTAIHNSGIDFPAKKTVINLSPATVRKRGAAFDLPIAVAILVALGQIPEKNVRGRLVIGELGLDGAVQKVPGILPIILAAREAGTPLCLVPRENAAEGALVDGVEVIGVGSLREVLEFLTGSIRLKPESRPEEKMDTAYDSLPDYRDILGQETVKRAAEVAVAGGHSLLLVGPPGSGKSMAARCISGILPPMTMRERIEITKIYSIMGLVEKESPLISQRPFRSVHHTSTKAALIGGGMIPTPGEISLAHGGVLFMDELPEFQKSVLEVLRQPLEEHQIRIARTQGSYVFPADFILIAAMNPCPCGNYPDFERCTCTSSQLRQYLGKISQPFLDRMDICVEAPRVEYEALSKKQKGETSGDIRKRICVARDIQNRRYVGTNISSNARLSVKELDTYCSLGEKEGRLMERAFETLGLTARTYHKIIKVARTIADIDGQAHICERHIKEAIGYRTMDKKYWGR